jgi:phosphate uptake regulator
MWKKILAGLKGSGLNRQAFDEALLMLEASYSMHRDAVAALHEKGILVADIYERDRQLNKYERSVRRKILTHFSVSPAPDINLGLVLTSIVIDIERIGDYTKNIVELAVALPEVFDGGELHEEVLALEVIVDGMFRDILPALRNSDVDLARTIFQQHKNLSGRVERGLQLLRSDQVLGGQSGRAVTAALYLRYLKRVSAHLKNIATSVLNPYYRIGYKEKDSDFDSAPKDSRQEDRALTDEEPRAGVDDIELLDEDGVTE